MKKVITILLAAVLVLVLAACAADPAPPEPVSPTAPAPEQTAEAEPEEIPQVEEDDSSDEPENNASAMIGDGTTIHPGLFVVGRDIQEGSFVITCVESDWNMRITLFESDEAYRAFLSSERFSPADEQQAILQNAWMTDDLLEGSSMIVNLQAGMVMMIDRRGVGEISQIENFINIDNERPIYNGVFVVGRDISEGSFVITCVESDWNMRITLFESDEAYRAFLSSERFSPVDEQQAILQNAWMEDSIREGESITVNLHDGMIMMIDRRGVGEIRLN